MSNKTLHQLALFGQPVMHSQSPSIHAGFAEQFGLHINYTLIDVSPECVVHLVLSFFEKGGTGANVTVPHKFSVAPAIDTLSESAVISGAVNTIVKNGKQLIGHNTDGIGLVSDLQNRANYTIKNKRILIIGAGGAAAGVLPALIKAKADHIYLANRTVEKAQIVAKKYPNVTPVSLSELESIDSSFDLIINATSLGLEGKTVNFPNNLIGEETAAYDMSYGQAALAFKKATQQAGIHHFYDGIGMLYYQAAHAFEIWFGKFPVVNIP